MLLRVFRCDTHAHYTRTSHRNTHMQCDTTYISTRTHLLLSSGVGEGDISKLDLSQYFLIRKHHAPCDGHEGVELHVLKHTRSGTHTTDNLTKQNGELTK